MEIDRFFEMLTGAVAIRTTSAAETSRILGLRGGCAQGVRGGQSAHEDFDDATPILAAHAGHAAARGILQQRLRGVAVGMLAHGPRTDDAVHDGSLIALRRIGDLCEPVARVPGWGQSQPTCAVPAPPPHAQGHRDQRERVGAARFHPHRR
jgi:hypothetical protein